MANVFTPPVVKANGRCASFRYAVDSYVMISPDGIILGEWTGYEQRMLSKEKLKIENYDGFRIRVAVSCNTLNY